MVGGIREIAGGVGGLVGLIVQGVPGRNYPMVNSTGSVRHDAITLEQLFSGLGNTALTTVYPAQQN